MIKQINLKKNLLLKHIMSQIPKKASKHFKKLNISKNKTSWYWPGGDQTIAYPCIFPGSEPLSYHISERLYSHLNVWSTSHIKIFSLVWSTCLILFHIWCSCLFNIAFHVWSTSHVNIFSLVWSSCLIQLFHIWFYINLPWTSQIFETFSL